MEFRDITKELSTVSSDYRFHKPPQFVDDFKETLGHILRAIADFLRELFHHSSRSVDSRSMSFLMQVMVYAAGAAAIICLLIFVIRRMNDMQAATTKTTRGAVEIEELLDAEGWKSQASKLATAKEYKGACRALYLSVLQNMDECGVAKFEPTKTNYEYAYSLSKYPDVQRDFKQMADLVEFIWFGNKVALDDDYTQSLRYANELDPVLKKIGEEKRQPRQQ